MSSWVLVEELFAATVGMDPAERARVLDERGHGDQELVQKVQALVAADATPLASFEEGAAELFRQLRDDPEPEDLVGATFGPYRIDEHLSSGGMAHVYRATRSAAGVDRRVAVKVLRPGLDTEGLLQRFQRERETLAALEHEHIVSFLDAGALPDGRPYLVMEFVDGVPLTTWSRAKPLRARLDVFMQVLATVQYAHQQLVVHRDLKPSNVLVTARNHPHLLDFGVASVLSAEGQGVVGAGPLTPSYASPEQLRGAPITTASDLYTLGLLLHELAVGTLPETDSRPSRLALPGDLGAIVAKALAPSPVDRYRSADHMGEDIRRYLDGKPVAARASTWRYRASRFARRNRWPLGLGVAVLVALIVGWIGSDMERRSAQREASAGWGAHGQAKVVARILEDWIATAAAADPVLGATALTHLERTIEDKLNGLPEAETFVHLALARLYLDREEFERASVHVERGWQLAQVTRGVGPHERERASDLRRQVRAMLALK